MSSRRLCPKGSSVLKGFPSGPLAQISFSVKGFKMLGGPFPTRPPPIPPTLTLNPTLTRTLTLTITITITITLTLTLTLTPPHPTPPHDDRTIMRRYCACDQQPRCSCDQSTFLIARSICLLIVRSVSAPDRAIIVGWGPIHRQHLSCR